MYHLRQQQPQRRRRRFQQQPPRQPQRRHWSVGSTAVVLMIAAAVVWHHGRGGGGTNRMMTTTRTTRTSLIVQGFRIASSSSVASRRIPAGGRSGLVLRQSPHFPFHQPPPAVSQRLPHLPLPPRHSIATTYTTRSSSSALTRLWASGTTSSGTSLRPTPPNNNNTTNDPNYYNEYDDSHDNNANNMEDETLSTTITTTPTHLLPPDYQFLNGLNPSQVEAVTQPITAITRVVAGPGSGKTRVLTCRIAYLLQQQQQRHYFQDDRPSQQQQQRPPRILAVTFTRKAAGEMQERLRTLLVAEAAAVTTATTENTDDDEFMFSGAAAADHAQRLSSLLDKDNTDNDDEGVLVLEHQGTTLQEVDSSTTTITNPPGLDRVMVGTFHSICARILRWNGDLLASLPSVVDDMQYSSNVTVLDRSFAICDQSEQLRIIKNCLEGRKIDLKTTPDIKPLEILTAVGQLKTERSTGVMNNNNNNKKPISKIRQIATLIYTDYRQHLLSSNCIDFDDLIQLARELLFHHPPVRQQLQRTWPHVLVDEFQDTSQSQMDLVKLLTSSSLFVVGDADQSIYSWRGANAASLSEFAQEFQTFCTSSGSSSSSGGGGGTVNTVYLMENYRSTSNIVKAAQKVISTSSQGGGDGEASVSSSPSGTGADQLRQAMKPKRGVGPKPRIVAFQDDKAEAEFVVREIQQRVTVGDYTPDHSVALIYRTNAQSRALEEACVQHNIPYVIFGSSTSFYKRQEIKDCLCFFRWLHNGHDRSSMQRAFKTPARGIGEAAVQGFEAYYEGILALLEEIYPSNTSTGSGDGTTTTSTEVVVPRPTPLDVLIELGIRTGGRTGDVVDTGMLVAPGQERPAVEAFLTKRQQTALGAFGRQMLKIRDLAHTEPVEKVLMMVVEELELVPHWDKTSKSKAEFQERQSNVEELRRAATRYSTYGPCIGSGGGGAATSRITNDDDPMDIAGTMGQDPLTMFLDDVALVTDLLDKSRDDTEGKRFVVSLMTIHASKGLEFDTVFLVGNEDGTFPTSQAIQEGEGSVTLEEEKRLCYVAMTRAKTELMMTWRKEVKMFTANGVRTVERKRSRFLDILVGKKTITKGDAGGFKHKAGDRFKSQSSNDNEYCDDDGDNDDDKYVDRPPSRRNEFGSPIKQSSSSRSSRAFPPPPSSYSTSSRRDFGSTSSTGPSQRKVTPSVSELQPWRTTSPPASSYSTSTRRDLGSTANAGPSNRQVTTSSAAEPQPWRTQGWESVMANAPPPLPVSQKKRRPTPATSSSENLENWSPHLGHESKDLPRRSSSPPMTPSRSAIPSTYQQQPVQQQQQQPARFNGQAASLTPKATKPVLPQRRAAAKTSMDSTWFFPVGTTVHHVRHGKGLVLEPPAKAQTIATDLPVLVQFHSDGRQLEFCARGSDLSPVG
jgi:DNA helicase II / ATP-dependent DNA helicase PcrA